MNIRKVTALLMALVMIFTLFSCKEKEVDDRLSVNALQEKIEIKTQAYMTDLMDSREGLTTNESIRKYIVSWAESKGIRVKTENDMVIMNVDGSEKYKDAPRTVIICPYDAERFDNTISSLILAFYVIKNNEDTGRLKALFVPETAHDLLGAQAIEKSWIGKKANVICLDSGQHAGVSRLTGGASRYLFAKEYSTGRPRNKLAYRIRISGISRYPVNNDINSKINPIVELNSLLASLRSSSVDFEIAGMKGGSEGMLYPEECVLTLTVDKDRQSVAEKKILSCIESFDRKKMAADPDAVFEYEETSLPSEVISHKDSAELEGLLYTLLKDEYHRADDTDSVMSVCDISYIRTKHGRVRIGSCALSVDDRVLTEIDDAEKTLSGLSGYRYKKTFSYPAWNEDETADSSEFTQAFKKAYKKYTGKKLQIDQQVTPEYTSRAAELSENSDILSVTVSENSLVSLTGAVMEYLIESDEPHDK